MVEIARADEVSSLEFGDGGFKKVASSRQHLVTDPPARAGHAVFPSLLFEMAIL